ncbi:Metacaspase-1 [Smittium mucronatum]|uniref:Metacaspase-1 n=1 Tax=Smittium mucronatum TaxID=133383 RepID=A0A1R0GLI1_9FUNG|nr:Metacaspase-1 [Smittium mucronatum]
MIPRIKSGDRNEDQCCNNGSYDVDKDNQQNESPQCSQNNCQQPLGYKNNPKPGEDSYSFSDAQNDQYQDPNQNNDEKYSGGVDNDDNKNENGHKQDPKADFTQDNYVQIRHPNSNYSLNENIQIDYTECRGNQKKNNPDIPNDQSKKQDVDENYNAAQFSQLFPPSIETYPNPEDWGQAPVIKLPVPTVIYEKINYSDMKFPEFSSGGNQNHNDQNNQTQGRNDQIYKSTSQEIRNQATNASISNCQGRKRALLIGVNYTGTKYKLRGCINDVHRMKKLIIDHFKFKKADMVILTDDQTDPKRIPTRENILKAMKWLVSGAQRNDSFFFHYSGHGSWVEDTNNDELDDHDETICPVDFEKNGQIIDEDMNAIMVRPLPPGARLTAVYDCCHSGTALDLPYMYDINGKLKNNNALNIAVDEAKEAEASYKKGNIRGALVSLTKSLKLLVFGRSKLEKARKEKSSMGDVIMFSGCKDTQTSADAHEDLNFIGAMSWALTNSLYAKPHQTYIELLNDIRQRLAEKYTQIPQLSTGRLMDMNTIFIM